MNASRFSRFCKGAVHDTKHLAGSVARVFKASFGLGFLAMPRSREVGSCAPQQCGTLFCLRFLGRDASEPSLPKFFFGGLGSNVPSRDGVQFKMPTAVMLLSRQALKVFNAVVQLVSVDVVNVLLGSKSLKPAHSYGSVKARFSAQGGVTVNANDGQVRVSVPQGFPASRDGVQVVHGSVFDAVYKYA
jgi:hypothetical protein